MPTAQAVDKRKLLEGHCLLGELSPADLDKLVSYARVVGYRAAHTIVLKGAPGPGVIAVI